jgi:hypothetical protein
MTTRLCGHCGTRPATACGVPASASVTHAPDGRPLDLHREMMFPIEPERWTQLCGPCVEQLMAAGALAGAFDLATWQDPRS